MPPIGTFSIAFGLVSIQVRLEPATRSHKIAFRQVHREDMGRVRHRKTCSLDGRRLEDWEVGRAWEAPDGVLVPVSDDELDHLPLPTAHTIEVTGFVDVQSVPAEVFDRPYFLAPAAGPAAKPYVLLREALARAGRAAVGKYALRGSGEALGLIYPRGEVLVLHRVRWPDELHSPAGLLGTPAVGGVPSEEEIGAAVGLIEALGEVDLGQMRDAFHEAAESLIDAKLAAAPVAQVWGPEHADAATADLMALLTEATGRARAHRAAEGRGAAGGRPTGRARDGGGR